ncbi:MAG: DUF2807 domain-containing protein [Saprospiraceae bacterium]|nr:DUF2807 domain-containing protein [Saprospiraceae bacterium]
MQNKLSAKLFTLLFLLSPIYLLAQNWYGKGVKGSGNVVTESRSHTNFDRVHVSSGLDVYFTQSNNYSVEVEADDNLIDIIKTEVNGGELRVKVAKGKSIKRSKKLVVHVSAPDLTGIKSSSGADFYSESVISGDNIIIDVSSGADVKVDLDYDKLKCEVSSGSAARLKGSANMAELRSSSGANIRAKELTVQRCKAKASSGSDVVVRVEKELIGDASSGGDVIYFGNPAEVDKSESSGGDVTAG